MSPRSKLKRKQTKIELKREKPDVVDFIDGIYDGSGMGKS
jgi:hypothetical protein